MRILVITAHPDDVDFGAAGSVAQWVDEGAAVTYCIVTNGDAGGFDPAVPRADIPGIRQGEQRAAAAAVGVTDVRFLGWPDGRVEPDPDLRLALTRVIRDVRPERVVTQSPERNWDRIGASHPDHLAVGEAALRAVYPDARNPFSYPEIADLPAHTVEEVWLMAGPVNDSFVDVTDTFDRKLAALRCHASQEVDRHGVLDERIRAWCAANAVAAGWDGGRLAEAFRRVVTA